MANIRVVDINLVESPSFIKAVEFSENNWSYYYTIGYALLKSVIRVKPFPSIKSPARHIEVYLDNALTLSIDDIYLGYIRNFKAIMLRFEKLPDPTQCYIELESYLTNTEFLNSLLYATYYIFSQLSDNLQVLDTDPLLLVKDFVKVSHLNFYIFWNGGNTLIQDPERKTGALINLFYQKVDNQNKLSFLIQSEDELIEHQAPDRKAYLEKFIYRSRETEEEQFEELSFCSRFPKLLNLAGSLVIALNDNNLVSQDTLGALTLAMNEVPDLRNIPTISSFVGNRELICQKHQDFQKIKMDCGLSHCQTCVFEKIKEEYVSVKSELLCLCKSYIPFEKIVQIKKSREYQNYFRNS